MTVVNFMLDKSLLEYLPETVKTRITQGKLSWFVTLLFGAVMPFTFAPFNTINSFFSYLIFLPLSLFIFQLLNVSSAKEAFFKGWLFGIGFFAVGVSWLYVAIHDFGGAHWSLAGILTAVFIIAIVIFYAFFSWSVYKIREKLNQSPRPINLPAVVLQTSSPVNKTVGKFMFDERTSSRQSSSGQSSLILFYIPVLWVFFEWLRSWVLTGFPWLLVGYPLIETPLSAYAPIIGIYGLSLLVIFISCLLNARIKPVYSVLAIILLMVMGVFLEKIQWSEPQGKALKVALIQGNVQQSVKWDRFQLEKTKQLYVNLSQQQWQSNDVIVWPENAIPTFYHNLASSFYHNLSLQAKATQTELITGLPVFDDDTQQYYNAMTNLGGQQGYYYKTHLVPFGEYVPLASLLRGLIKFFNMPMSGFDAGKTDQPLISIKGNKVVVSICYEDVYAEDVMRQIPQAQWMLNLSNNGWYGDSFAPHQHLEMARMRALESSRDLVRSTTSGISALIDYKGQIIVKGPQFKTAIVTGSIQPRTGITPYVFWANYPVLILFVITTLLLFLLFSNRVDKR